MNSNTLSILIIEDQAAIAKNIATYLEEKGYVLDFASDGYQGLELALNNIYDVIILDIMLPGIDGLSVCQQIRAKANRHVPILMLTARDTISDKVTGFEKGADDYLTKPFALEELEVRTIALSKRHLLQTNHIISVGPVTVDRKLRKITREKTELNFNSVGYKVILALAEAYPQVLTRSELVNKIWGDEPTESDALRSHIYQVRAILDKPFKSKLLKTIHGVGFVLDCE